MPTISIKEPAVVTVTRSRSLPSVREIVLHVGGFDSERTVTRRGMEPGEAVPVGERGGQHLWGNPLGRGYARQLIQPAETRFEDATTRSTAPPGGLGVLK